MEVAGVLKAVEKEVSLATFDTVQISKDAKENNTEKLSDYVLVQLVQNQNWKKRLENPNS